MRWLYLVLLAGIVMSAQAQKESADTAMQEYFKNFRFYSVPGISDSVFKKHLEDGLRHQHEWDSLEHLLDSLRSRAIPAYLCRVSQARYSASNEAIFCWHSFSAIACSFRTRSIRRRSSSAVIS
jgi:hypothetical protein